MTSHVQRSNIISRTIPSYHDEEEPEEQEESDFRPTHLDISQYQMNLIKIYQKFSHLIQKLFSHHLMNKHLIKDNQYEKLLYETSNDIVQSNFK